MSYLFAPFGTLQTQVIDLTASQLTHLFSSPLELLPAPGANLMIMPVEMYLQFFPGSNIYGDVSQGIQITYGSYDPGDNPDIVPNIPTNAQVSGLTVFDRFKMGDNLVFSNVANQPINLVYTAQDLLFGITTSVSIANGGTLYAMGDTGAIEDASGANAGNEATYTVLTVDGGGAILTFTLDTGGVLGQPGYKAGQTYDDDAGSASGIGTGATWLVNTITQGNGTAKIFIAYRILSTV